MSIVNNSLLFAGDEGYSIARSVRLRSSASAYFNRTPASATNRKTYTFSAWIKNGGTEGRVFGADTSNAGTNTAILSFGSNGQVASVQLYISGTYNLYWQSTAVYRDPSAWYHVVFVVDTTQASSANAVKIYVNGLQITLTFTAFTGSYTQNMDTAINNNVSHLIGIMNAFSQYFDGYLTEINFIDGQALTPSSFGETDSITGVWKPKAYSGTYGTNGFYLNFSDNSSNTATTIGKDYSGNGNNWTPNNISVTSGVTYDSMTDVPTLTSATAANYCVVNPLDKGGGVTITDGNLTLTRASSVLDWDTARCTIQVPSTGQYYWELTLVSGSNDGCLVGVGTATADLSQEVNGFWAYQSAGYIIYNGSYTTATALSVGDVVMVAFDRTNNKLWFGRNGTWGLNGGTPVTPTDPNSNFTSLPSNLFPAVGIRYTANSAINFGQRPFSYTPPTGFVALNTYNLPASTIKNGAAYMAATTYTGTGSALTISNAVNGVSFQPDLVWVKDRTAAQWHNLTDSVRGVGKELFSNATNAEETNGGISSLNSNGFSLINWDGANKSSDSYVAWQWKAGGTSASNTNGSITSTVSAGATQGFSVVTYTGSGSASSTVGHGLGVAPNMIILKNRSTVVDWPVMHTSLPTNGNMFLDLTQGYQTTYSAGGILNPATSTTFGFTTTSILSQVNASGDNYVAYCFAAVAGYSAFGSYTGNGSTDGPFVYTGFRPRYVLIKSTAVENWTVQDSSRNTYNVIDAALFPALSNAESTGNANLNIDFLSNGFKVRSAGATINNTNGQAYIYAAFAENPTKYALAR